MNHVNEILERQRKERLTIMRNDMKGMSFDLFKSYFPEYSGAGSYAIGKNNYYEYTVYIGRITISYDVKGDYFDIMKDGDYLLDGCDLRTAIAFYNLEKE